MTVRLRAWAAMIAVGLGQSGCATAYHDYPCGSVPYGYCPPTPLPYTSYCGCPTPVAEKFQAGTPSQENQHASDPY